MLFAVRVGEQYRPTRDLDLLGLGEASEAAVATAIRDIAATKVDDDGLLFDVDGLEVHAIREPGPPVGRDEGGLQRLVDRALTATSRGRDRSATEDAGN